MRWVNYMLLAAAAVLAACSTTPETEPTPAAATLPPISSRVTFSQAEGPIGLTIRRIGEKSGGGIVLVNGLEDIRVSDLSYRQEPIGNVAADLARRINGAVQESPRYYFIYPPGMEVLLDVTLAGKLDARYSDIATQLAFGSGMPLFTVFSWIGQGLAIGDKIDVAIVADNEVAQQFCGEISLGELPLQEGLEAILRSARVGGFGVDSTPEYIFIYSLRNPSPQSLLLNEEQLDEQQRAMLERRVNVMLPRPPANPSVLEMHAGAQTLSSVITSLSEQLGVRVVAERSLLDIPINPVVMRGVRVRTALDLLIRQWPVQDFGYQVTHDRIVIRLK